MRRQVMNARFLHRMIGLFVVSFFATGAFGTNANAQPGEPVLQPMTSKPAQPAGIPVAAPNGPGTPGFASASETQPPDRLIAEPAAGPAEFEHSTDYSSESFGRNCFPNVATPLRAPFMLGDFLGTFYVGGPPGSETRSLKKPGDIARAHTIYRFKVADNNSPLPVSRVLYSYNYFNDAYGLGGEVHRNFLGAEYAFNRNTMSVDIKLNVNTFTSFPQDTVSTDFGDITTTFKWAFLRRTNFLMSGGIQFGWPTGKLPQNISADYNYYISPYIGYLWSSDDSPWFLQGFEQFDLPTDSQDQSMVQSDVGVGYWVVRDPNARFLKAFAPTVELHAYNPLGDAPSGALTGLVYDTVVNLTIGASFFIYDGITAALGFGLPISDGRDYDYELQAHVNILFPKP